MKFQWNARIATLLCLLMASFGVLAAKNVGPQQSFNLVLETLTAGSEAVIPAVDEDVDLGASGNPFDVVYATDVSIADDLTVTDDLAVTGLATVGETLAVTGNTTLNGDVSGDGGDQLVGFLQAQTASTTVALTVAQCGGTLVNNSADVMTLPEASTALGCRFTLAVNNASNFDINPADGTDIILPYDDGDGGALISPSAGDAIRCAVVGGSITLEAVDANSWIVISRHHDWADVN